MSDYLENEAEESDDEVISRKRKIQSDDEDDEEEEEDDEEKLKEEMKDLINDDPEEEEKDDSEEEIGHRKKKRRDDYDDGLEDEDYDLIEENLGVKVQRKKKFRRLRRIEDEESDNDEDADGGDAREAIANELFEGDDGEEEDIPRPTVDDTQLGDEESEEESDENDFIVDDEGQPISKGRKKRHIKYNDAALQEAQEIFGVDFDYNDFVGEGDEYEEEMDEDYEEDEYEEEGESRPRPKKAGRKRTTKKSIFDVFEPIELERSHLTDLDKEIRSADIPERFQLRNVPVTEADDDEIKREAEWIYKQAFNVPTVSIQEGENAEQGVCLWQQSNRCSSEEPQNRASEQVN